MSTSLRDSDDTIVKLTTPITQIAKQYCGAQRSQLPPHVFAVADKAYQVLLREQADQVRVLRLYLGVSASVHGQAGQLQASHSVEQPFYVAGHLLVGSRLDG